MHWIIKLFRNISLPNETELTGIYKYQYIKYPVDGTNLEYCHIPKKHGSCHKFIYCHFLCLTLSAILFVANSDDITNLSNILEVFGSQRCQRANESHYRSSYWSLQGAAILVLCQEAVAIWTGPQQVLHNGFYLY